MLNINSLAVGGGGLRRGAKAKFAVSTWLTALRLHIPCLFLCLTTAVFPVRQEVSSVSCHSPLSCGHFLVFCQRRSVLLTQRTEVVLLAVGSVRTEKKSFYYLWLHGLAFRDTVMSGHCIHYDYIPQCKNKSFSFTLTMY